MHELLLYLFGLHGATEIGHTDEEVSSHVSHLKN